MINKDSKHNETTTSRTNIPPDIELHIMFPSLILRLADIRVERLSPEPLGEGDGPREKNCNSKRVFQTFLGVMSTFVGYPLDTIKVTQQNFSTSMAKAATTVYRADGLHGFFKGMSPPLVAYGPSNSIFFGWYSIWMRILEQDENIRVNRYNFDHPHIVASMLIAGSIGGLCQILFMCPVDLIKITMQTSTYSMANPSIVKDNRKIYDSSFQAFLGILKNHGVTGLFRGFVPMCIRDIPTSGVYMVSYEYTRHVQMKYLSNNNWFRQILAGGVAGVLSTVPVQPIDVVKTRMQADNLSNPEYKGTVDCILKLYKREGITVFFNGTAANAFRSFPFHATIFLGYELTMQFLNWFTANYFKK